MLFNEPKLLKSSFAVSQIITYSVSVLFNEPKLLKSLAPLPPRCLLDSFSALQRAEIAETHNPSKRRAGLFVSVLFNEPKLLKQTEPRRFPPRPRVSVLFNEPKLLKFAEIPANFPLDKVSVLFNEPKLLKSPVGCTRI